ncbi:MAG TPA: hypothetical protein DCE41_26590 [Cytophagales bacterium]|nr:hypothetical protein [Cytophagales bacterium]HAA22533.1 hypothetical protein [Cytophagales bacterium]HAP61403.1 hypothetical protein [Cytophagales bacterium]
MKGVSLLSTAFRTREDKLRHDTRQNFRLLLLLLSIAWFILQASIKFYVPHITPSAVMIISVPVVMFGLFLLTFRRKPLKPRVFIKWVYGGFYFMIGTILWMITIWSTNYVLLFGLGTTVLLTSIFFESTKSYLVYISTILVVFFIQLIYLYGSDWQEILYPFLVMGAVGIAGSLYLRLKFQTQSQLREKDDLLQSFYRKADNALIITDLQGRIVDMNQRSGELLVANRSVVVGQSMYGYLQETYGESAFERILNTATEKGYWHDTVEFNNSLGEIFWGELHIRNLKVGREIFLYFAISNITGQLMHRVALKEREVKYRLLMEEASDGILLFDQEGKIIEANSKAGLLFGQSVKELVGKAFLHLLAPQRSDSQSVSLENINGAEELMERTFVKADGTSVVLEMSIRSIPNDYSQVILRDVSRRKAVEEALIQSERRFRALIENSRDIVLILDAAYRISYMSPSLERLLQIDPAKLLGTSFIQLVDETYQEAANAALDRVSTVGEQEEVKTLVIKSAAGVSFYFEVLATNLLDDLEVKGIVLNLHDISARRRTEHQLEQANFELDSFIYKASHDMRSPLLSILGLVNLARKAKAVELPRYFELMEKGVHRLDKFIRDLTHYSRNDRMKVERKLINLHEMVREIVENLRFMKNLERVRITLDVKSQTPIYSDAMRLSIVLGNLISNAVKYHDVGKYNPYVRLEIWVDRERIKMVIQDNGIGIEAPYLDKIFDMFYRASELSDGSGLGLYVAQSVAKKLNGSLTVQSEYRQGTTFTLELPNMKMTRAEALLADEPEDEMEEEETEESKVIPLHHRAQFD